MRILYICNEYPPAPHGGIGSVTRTLARGVAKAGHKAVVVGLDRTRTHSSWTTDGLVDIYRIAADRLPATTLRWGEKKWSVESVQAGRRLSDRLDRLLKVVKPDLIESHDWSGPLWRHPGCPLVVRMHGCALAHAHAPGSTAGRVDYFLERRNLRMADALVAVSHETAMRTSRAAGLELNTVTTIHNGVDTEVFRRQPVDDHELDVLFAGTVCERKGIREIFAALPGIHWRYPDAQFSFVGRMPAGGVESPLLRELRAGLPPAVRARLHFLGPRPLDEMPAVYSRATLAVFASLSEAFGMACVEAMACECPVVMTSLGSGPEIVADGANGLLVDPRDTDDLVSAVLELLGDSSLRHRLAFAARSLVCRKFNASNQLEVNLEFYQSVIRSAGSKWKSAA